MLDVERTFTGIPVALLTTLSQQNPASVENTMVTLRAPERQRLVVGRSHGKAKPRIGGVGRNKTATWIRKGVVARVRHLRGKDTVRHATLQSLEVDKPISDEE